MIKRCPYCGASRMDPQYGGWVADIEGCYGCAKCGSITTSRTYGKGSNWRPNFFTDIIPRFVDYANHIRESRGLPSLKEVKENGKIIHDLKGDSS